MNDVHSLLWSRAHHTISLLALERIELRALLLHRSQQPCHQQTTLMHACRPGLPSILHIRFFCSS